MSDSEKATAEKRSDDAFSAGPFQDPRGAFRERLRSFRESEPAAFKSALAYFEQKLIPQIAGGSDPIVEWVNYGRRLGELTGRGKTYAVDPTGRARPLGDDFSADQLILHVPDDTAVAALAIALPRELSAPQQATYDLLISRARALS